MQSQAPEDIFPLEGITPDPAAPHSIERETGEGANPQPWQVEPPVGAETPQPWQVEPPVGVTNPDPGEVAPPPSAPNPDPGQIEPPVSAPNPEPWPIEPPTAIANPDQIQVEVPPPAPTPDRTEWDTGRNSAAPVDPIEWIDRARDGLPQVPEVEVEIPQPPEYRSRLRRLDGAATQETYWVSDVRSDR